MIQALNHKMPEMPYQRAAKNYVLIRLDNILPLNAVGFYNVCKPPRVISFKRNCFQSSEF